MVSFAQSPDFPPARTLLEPLFTLAGCTRELKGEVIGRIFSWRWRDLELMRFHFAGLMPRDPIRLAFCRVQR